MNHAGVKLSGDFVDNYRKGPAVRDGAFESLRPTHRHATGDHRRHRDHRDAHGRGHSAGRPASRPPDSKVLGHIGARGTAYWNVRLLDRLFDFDEIRVHSRRPESRDAFGAKLAQDLGKPVRVVDDWRQCVEGADIVVEASRLPEPEPLLRTEWIKPSAFVVPYGTMSAVELSLTDIMDKIVVDDWGQCRQGPFGSLRRHVETAKLSAETLHAELAEIVAGSKPGRETAEETILFWHRGLSLSDIALGHAILEKAAALEIGTQLRFA
jgi:ornithine cyclodeaminase